MSWFIRMDAYGDVGTAQGLSEDVSDLDGRCGGWFVGIVYGNVVWILEEGEYLILLRGGRWGKGTCLFLYCFG